MFSFKRELQQRLSLAGAGLFTLLAASACLPIKQEPGAGSLAQVVAPLPARQLGSSKRVAASERHYANFSGKSASKETKFIAAWVADSGDNQGLSFVIIDKKNAAIFVFDAFARLLGSTPVLLGAATGDDSVPGIGERPISQVQFSERTTPAGRFRAEPGVNLSGEDVVWIDYDAAVSMHRVRVVDPRERRIERLASPTTKDNRISYGCVNVPVAFYENVLSPMFNSRYGVVYVLPEQKSLRSVFPSAYDPSKKYPDSMTTRKHPPANVATPVQKVRSESPVASGKV